ncbi:MAG: COR domain-containing protein [Candidatus Sedimenticola sp. (ex Thyasira tokunagai)]
MEVLEITARELGKLPEFLGQLKQLQTLHLTNNKITELPESLGQLKQLRRLILSNNELTNLPESLGQLEHLEILDIANNKLTELPESLDQLKRLQTLQIVNNKLTELPRSLGQLTQMYILHIDDNELTNLPESLGQLKQLQLLALTNNEVINLPESLGQLKQLQTLDIGNNKIAELPESLGQLKQLRSLILSNNEVINLPESLGQLEHLQILDIANNKIAELPESLGRLKQLRRLFLSNNEVINLPESLAQLEHLEILEIGNNPLNPELLAAQREGAYALKRYLEVKFEDSVELNEGKLILVGEGEVGKSCLLSALRGDPWVENRPTTHGIEIKPVDVENASNGKIIILNGWDFGGQRVYRPTHQLFFSAPAIYLVVWKPREGPQQGFVKEWIKLIKHREPEAKILIISTHGGPKERQPDIDRQEIWDLFGRETVIDFFQVESRPDVERCECKGIFELKQSIAKIATALPEVGRRFPKKWQRVREELGRSKEAYMSLDRYFALCKKYKVEQWDVHLLLRICHRVGDLIHYPHDLMLRDIIVLKPDWLAIAISFVLDDEKTRKLTNGLVNFSRLSQLWNDPERPVEHRYPKQLHPIFLRLMERFDLSYQISDPTSDDLFRASLIAQLVPDVRPNPISRWSDGLAVGDQQQVQICRIIDSICNEPATAEGLFFQLIVRLHKFSLGRADYSLSVHWQRGLLLEDETGALAFLELVGTDVRITVRSPYPERFLSALTYEVKWLVESYWRGMHCKVTVPCMMLHEDGRQCSGLFEVVKLIENKRRERTEQPCSVCNEWQSIEQLLHNAPSAQANPMEDLLLNFDQVKNSLETIRGELSGQHTQIIGRFDEQDAASRELVSKVESAYDGLIQLLVDDAKEGPRLFSFVPVDPGFWDRPGWVSTKFRVTLWCEHSRLPLPELYGNGSTIGIYEMTLPHDWLIKSAPFLKLLSTTLSLVLPVASSATKLVLDDTAYKGIAEQLDLGQKTFDGVLKGGEKSGAWMGHNDTPDLMQGEAIEANGAVLRRLRFWLNNEDPGLGGLIRVMNKRQEFLWVHPQFESEY